MFVSNQKKYPERNQSKFINKKILTENSVIKLDLYLPLCIAAGQKSSEGNWDVLSFQSSKISLISALA